MRLVGAAGAALPAGVSAWDKVGNVAQGLAAVATVVAVGFAWRSARSARQAVDVAREEASSAWRPVVLIDGRPVVSFQDTTTLDGTRVRTMQVNLRNVGRGPALEVFAMVDEAHNDIAVPPVRRNGAVADGGTWELFFELPVGTLECHLNVDYSDIGGRQHAMESTILNTGEELEGAPGVPTERKASVRESRIDKDVALIPQRARDADAQLPKS